MCCSFRVANRLNFFSPPSKKVRPKSPRRHITEINHVSGKQFLVTPVFMGEESCEKSKTFGRELCKKHSLVHALSPRPLLTRYMTYQRRLQFVSIISSGKRVKNTEESRNVSSIQVRVWQRYALKTGRHTLFSGRVRPTRPRAPLLLSGRLQGVCV